MRKRNLGKTGLDVSELSLGTWGLSGDGYGPVVEADQDEVIERALSLGINLFETAGCYGRGAMEKKLGQSLPKDAIIVTKLGTDRDGKPPRKRFDRAFLTESLDKSEERLQRRPDVVLLHNPSVAATKAGDAAKLMQTWVDEGRIRAWGISAGDAEVVNAALENEPRPAVVQLAYNALFSNDVDAVRQDLSSYGIGLLARSILGHGLLAGFWGTNRRFPREDHRLKRWTQDQLERRLKEVNALRSAVTLKSPNVRSVAIRFVLDDETTSSAVLGPRTALQLDQLVREAGAEPPYLEPSAKHRLTVRLMDLGALR